MDYPPTFLQNTLDIFQDKGQEWLDNLPKLLSSLEDLWAIRISPPFSGLSYNYVAPAVHADGSSAILKVWIPNPELTSEMETLRYYDGRGFARLLECAPELGAMLLERLEPGSTLADLDDDDEATRIAAGLMKDLWLPAPDNTTGIFPTTQKWSRGLQRLRKEFGGRTGPFPSHLVEKAERLFADLEASADAPVLLHGDLHHWNILAAQRNPWLAIDPKGLIGEPAYEPSQLFLNRCPIDEGKGAVLRQAERRLSIFTEVLSLDPQRIIGWTFAKAVLSTWWTYEDNHRVDEEGLELASALSKMAK